MICWLTGDAAGKQPAPGLLFCESMVRTVPLATAPVEEPAVGLCAGELVESLLGEGDFDDGDCLVGEDAAVEMEDGAATSSHDTASLC